MNNILNSRIKRLIKEDLWDYGKCLLGFLGFVGITLIFNLLFDNFAIVNIDVDIVDFISIMISLTSFGAITFIMAMVGITAGSELQQYVRSGVARIEYFIATTVAAIIVSLLIAPLILLLNVIINLFVNHQSLFYNAFFIGGGQILTLAMHALTYIMAFLVGFFVTIFWQRFGWKIALAIMIPFFIVFNSLIWNVVFPNVFNANFEDYEFYAYWDFSSFMNEFFSITNVFMSVTVIGLIALLGVGTYTLIRCVPVKVK